jgi:xanthine dehydrogenase iron-sulfur cluster and FAD-binding subunit A
MQKHILSTLTSMGEWLVSELRQHDITAKAGVTMADVEATLEELYVSLRISFGGMTETRRAQVLDEVFGAS